jgi:hypothetical protein
MVVETPPETLSGEIQDKTSVDIDKYLKVFNNLCYSI